MHNAHVRGAEPLERRHRLIVRRARQRALRALHCEIAQLKLLETLQELAVRRGHVRDHLRLELGGGRGVRDAEQPVDEPEERVLPRARPLRAHACAAGDALDGRRAAERCCRAVGAVRSAPGWVA